MLYGCKQCHDIAVSLLYCQCMYNAVYACSRYTSLRVWRRQLINLLGQAGTDYRDLAHVDVINDNVIDIMHPGFITYYYTMSCTWLTTCKLKRVPPLVCTGRPVPVHVPVVYATRKARAF